MIIRKLQDITCTNREVNWGNGISRRFLLEKDGMGYSLTDTIVRANTSSLLEYKKHMEACYCISGSGLVVEAAACAAAKTTWPVGAVAFPCSCFRLLLANHSR